MQDFSQIKSVIQILKIIIKAMKRCQIGQEDIDNVKQTVEEVNSILYHCGRPKFMEKFCFVERKEDFQNFAEKLEGLIEKWELTINRRQGLWIDVEFWEIYEFFKYVDADLIFEAVKEHFLRLPEGIKIEFLALPNRYTYLKDKIDYIKNDYSLIKTHVDMMVEHVEDYRWLYQHLADHRSRIVLNGIIKYWFRFDLDQLYPLLENVFPDYYDSDILQCGEEDVVVDLGAYTGDSILNYIHTYGCYKRIYAYEISEKTFGILKEKIAGWPDIVLREKGAGSRTGTMYVDISDNGAGNRLLEEGGKEIEVAALDDDITEPVSVIKMDIEGAEKDAIKGAEKHIVNEKPKLLISAYHCPEDIFEIPAMIHSMREDYKYYLRFNGRGCLWPCDYILFAV